MNNHTTIFPLESEQKNSERRRNQKAVLRLLDSLRIEGRLEPAPGFSHALFLNYERLLPHNFVVEKSRKRRLFLFRHVPPPELAFGETVSLGTYLAVLHEVTMWALMAHGKRPRVSVNLHAEWANSVGKEMPRIQPGAPYDIVATVEKAGENIGFVKAHVLQQNRTIVDFGGHVKHLRTGFWSNLLVKGGKPLKKLYSNIAGSEPTPQTYSLGELFKNLKFQSAHRATFSASSAHGSRGTALHGGCQSMLMELVGEQTAKDALSAYNVELQSLNVTSVSRSTPSVVIRAKVLNYNESYAKTQVVILARTEENPNGGRVISEGVLQWMLSDVNTGRRRPLPQTSDFSMTAAAGSCMDMMGGRRREEDWELFETPVTASRDNLNSFAPSQQQRLQSTPSMMNASEVSLSSNDYSDTTPRLGPQSSNLSLDNEERFEERDFNLFSSNTRLLPPSLRLDDDSSTWSPVSSKRYSYSLKASSELGSNRSDVNSQGQPPVDTEFHPFEMQQSSACTDDNSLASSSSLSLLGSDDGFAQQDSRRQKTASPGLSSIQSWARTSNADIRDSTQYQSSTSPPPPPENARERHICPPRYLDVQQHDDDKNDGMFDRLHNPYLGSKHNKTGIPKTSSPGLKSNGLEPINVFPSGRKKTRVEDFDVSSIPTAQVFVLPVAEEARDRDFFDFL